MIDSSSDFLVVCAGSRVNPDCSRAMGHVLADPQRQHVKFLMWEWLSDHHLCRASLVWIVDDSTPWDAIHFALSNGIPILVADQNAMLRELCLLANCGLFYRHDIDALLCLQLLIETPTLQRQLGANGSAQMARHNASQS